MMINFLRKGDNAKWLGFYIAVASVILVLISMFTTIDHTKVDPYELTHGKVITYRNIAPQFNIDLSQGIRLMVLGVFSGLIGGMMGMGGGVVKTSGLMLIFGVEVLLVRTISLITNVFIYGSAAYKYSKKNGLVIKKVAELMIPGAILGVASGFLLGNVLATGWLKELLGLFAIFSGLDMARRVFLVKEDDDEENQNPYTKEKFKRENKIKIAGAGYPMGLVMGLFGISGGVIGIPYQKFALGIPIKNAIGNTAVTSFVASLIAVFLAFWYEYTYRPYEISAALFMAACIVPGNIIGAQLGAALTGRILPVRFIKIFYIVLMCTIGLKLVFPH